jgi:crotonobetaine/carnitine-CoA ligase
MADSRLPVSVAALLLSRTAQSFDKVVIRSDQGNMTYGEIEDRSRVVANNLAAAGVRRGDSVATMLEETHQVIAVWFACARAGFVEVPLSGELKGDLLVEAVKGANCSVVIANGGSEAIRQLESIEERLPPISEVADLERAASTDQFSDSPLEPDEVSLILYTSGTTGQSKGVRLTDRMTVRLAWSVIDNAGLTSDDILLTVFPLHHIAARFVSVVAAMLIDSEVVIRERFSASRFWKVCTEYGVTAVHYLGTLPMMLWNQPNNLQNEQSPVRVAYGAGMPKEIEEGFAKRFDLEIFELYGSTEQGVATMSRKGASKLGTCGRPVADIDLEIQDTE